MNCTTCMIGDFKNELCPNEFCEKCGAEGTSEDVESILMKNAVSEWIPCEDRLPSKSGTYLVTYEWVGQSGTKYTEIEVIDFERGRWSDHTRHYEKVTAWMPLPKPYEEVKENE